MVSACWSGACCTRWQSSRTWWCPSNRKGETVFLNAGLDALFRRLKAAKHSRPLLRGKPDDELRDFIRAGVEERMRWYSMAKHEICSDELETREQIGRTVELFRQLLGI